MKSILIFAVLLPGIALASAYGGAEGTNKRGEIIHIAGDLAETIYVQKNKRDSEWKESYAVSEECPSFQEIFGGKKQFSCRENGKSPLAGATYKVTTSKKYRPCNTPPYSDKTPGEVYVCIAGCNNSRAPKIFYVSPWEC